LENEAFKRSVNWWDGNRTTGWPGSIGFGATVMAPDDRKEREIFRDHWCFLRPSNTYPYSTR